MQRLSASQNHLQQKQKDDFFQTRKQQYRIFRQQILILEETQMYGLVNKAVESLVLSKFGQDTWDIICEKANISGPIILMKS